MTYKWRPLKRIGAIDLKPRSPAIIEEAMRHYAIDEAAAIKMLDEYDAGSELYINDLYQVQVRRYDNNLVHLNIRRRDGAHDIRDWRHFQRIKNELIGEECEAIELYPAESRLVDTSNKFHLWAIADPKFRFPIGFDDRQVQDDHDAGDVPGLRQRGRS